MNKIPKRTFLLLTSFTLFFILGCAAHRQNKILAQEKLQSQRTNYANLSKDLKSNVLSIGTEDMKIRTLYGPPSSTFGSGSSVSSFEIWTYKNILPNKEEDEWSAIHLYLNNHKLVSWKY